MKEKGCIIFASTISNPTIHLKIRKSSEENEPPFLVCTIDDQLLEKTDIGQDFTKKVRSAQLTVLRRRIVRMIALKYPNSENILK